MTIVTPSRGRSDLPHLPDRYFGSMERMAMSASIPSISPRLQSILPPVLITPPSLKMDKSPLNSHAKSNQCVLHRRKRSFEDVPQPTAPPRPILAEKQINSNLPTHITPSRHSIDPSRKSLRQPSIVNSIPRPALSPDVFAPCQSGPSIQSIKHPVKRPHESASASCTLLKRIKVDERREIAANNALAHRVEEERWTTKWIKVFPTLVFHFEIGAEEGAGKSLAARVTKMGAVSYHLSSVV